MAKLIFKQPPKKDPITTMALTLTNQYTRLLFVIWLLQTIATGYYIYGK